MVTKVGGVAIEIRGDNAHFVREMRESERAAGRTGQKITREFRKADTATKSLNTSIKSSTTSMLALGAALGVGAGLASGIRTIADFGQAMSTLAAVTGATAGQMGALEAEAKRLGGTTRFSASQAAEGMIFLARAGFTASEALQAVEGTLQLAQAGGLDLGRAADIASNVLGGFNLTVDETSRVVDVLAKAANSANVTVDSLGEALKFAAPTAAALGLSLEETVAMIGKLGDSGLAGGLGGRGFSAFATSFVAKKDEITAIIGEFDLAGEGLNNLIKRLVQAGITTDQVIKIFRAENLDVFTILANASQDAAKGTAVLTEKLNDAGGTAARVAKTMDDNLNGAVLGASSAFESLVLAMGEAGGEQILIDTFKGLADLLRFAAANADVLGVAIVALSARALIPMAVSVVPAAIGALRGLGVALLGVQGAAAPFAFLMGTTLTVAIAAAAVGYIALSRSTITAADAQARFNDAMDKLKGVKSDLLSDYGALARANETLAAAIESGGDAAEAAARKEVDAINLRIAKNKELSQVYTVQIRASLEAARAAERAARNDVSQGVGLGRRFDYGTNPEARAELDAATQSFLDMVGAAQASGRALSENETKTLDAIIAYKDAADSAAGLEAQLRKLGSLGGDFRDEVFPVGGAAGRSGGGSVGTSDAIALDREGLAIRQQIVAIDLARAQGNEELANHLEEELDILQAQLEYQELGLSAVEAMDAAITEIVGKRQAAAQFAQEQAAADEASALAMQRYDEFRLKQNEANQRKDDEARAEAELQDRIADSISRGLEEGIRSDNWGQAFRGILASATTSALSEAIDDLAGALVGLFKSAFSGVNLGGSGGGIGSIFGSLFGGGRASGGSVRAGMRYMVSEQGPEMFVPTVPGMVVPRFEGPSSAALNGVGGGSSISVTAPFIVQGSITEDVLPRVQAMIAEQSRQLPRIIDSQVRDSTRRGRYS